MEEKKTRRSRTRRPGLAFTLSDYVPLGGWWPTPCLQIARTLGLDWDYGHPNLEVRVNYDPRDGSNAVLSEIFNRIRDGARYAAGDRLTIAASPYNEACTVEFRDSTNEFGPCLLAVVLGIAEDFQSLPSREADAWLEAHPQRTDPFAGYN